jgi:hypothetical protein
MNGFPTGEGISESFPRRNFEKWAGHRMIVTGLISVSNGVIVAIKELNRRT